MAYNLVGLSTYVEGINEGKDGRGLLTAIVRYILEDVHSLTDAEMRDAVERAFVEHAAAADLEDGSTIDVTRRDDSIYL